MPLPFRKKIVGVLSPKRITLKPIFSDYVCRVLSAIVPFKKISKFSFNLYKEMTKPDMLFK